MGKAFLVKDKANTFWISPTWLVDKCAKLYVDRPIVSEWIFTNNSLFTFFNYHIKSFRLPYYITSVLSETVYNRFLEVISQNSEQPFFAWIHVLPPHNLYLPPNQYMGIFGDAEKFNTDEK